MSRNEVGEVKGGECEVFKEERVSREVEVGEWKRGDDE